MFARMRDTQHSSSRNVRRLTKAQKKILQLHKMMRTNLKRKYIVRCSTRQVRSILVFVMDVAKRILEVKDQQAL